MDRILGNTVSSGWKNKILVIKYNIYKTKHIIENYLNVKTIDNCTVKKVTTNHANTCYQSTEKEWVKINTTAVLNWVNDVSTLISL